MKDFEKYLKEHQTKLDLDTVRPEVWVKIENDILKQASTKQSRRIKFISILVLLLIATILYQYSKPKMQVPPELLAQYGIEHMADIDKQIEARIQLIKCTPVSKNHKDDVQLLLNQVGFLDELYQAKIDRKPQGEHEILVTELILEYYKNKSELLEKVLNEINKINTYEEEYKITNEKLLLNI